MDKYSPQLASNPLVTKWFDIFDDVCLEAKKRMEALPVEYWKDVTTSIFIQTGKESNIDKMVAEKKATVKQANPLINATKEAPVKGLEFISAKGITDSYGKNKLVIETNLGEISLNEHNAKIFLAQNAVKGTKLIGYQTPYTLKNTGKVVMINVLQVEPQVSSWNANEVPF